ncbi:hypothetical protein Mapa_003205 [Marchantia paleacea]|nr:hypothetical protein Mapa_003205 [Marchantia paleacea]
MEPDHCQNHMHDEKWTTIHTRLVQPEVLRDPEWMQLTPLDHMQAGKLMSFLFLYKPKSEIHDRNGADGPVLLVDSLMKSLAKALVHFYPFAGRLIKNEKHDPVRLFCNNEGAVWIHKRFDGVVSDLLDEGNFQPNVQIAGVSNIQPTAPTYGDSGLPALIVQVTEFLCGTVSLCVTSCHHVADGFSSLHFLRSWAEITRGATITLLPVHDRSLLQPRTHNVDVGQVSTTTATTFTDVAAARKQLPVRTFRYSQRRIDELKSEAQISTQLSSSDQGGLSSVDCMSARIWCTLIETAEREHHTVFVNLVDGRARLKDFPKGYFGNCVIGAWQLNPQTVGDILSNPLSYAATVIRDAVRRVDDEVVRSWVDLLGKGGRPFTMPQGPVHMILTSWMHRFPFYEVDFGSGPPAVVFQNSLSQDGLITAKVTGLPAPDSNPGGVILTVEAAQCSSQLFDEM